jgi:hypothetical protein
MESLADDKAKAKYSKEAFCIGFNVGAGSLLALRFITLYKWKANTVLQTSISCSNAVHVINLDLSNYWHCGMCFAPVSPHSFSCSLCSPQTLDAHTGHGVGQHTRKAHPHSTGYLPTVPRVSVQILISSFPMQVSCNRGCGSAWLASALRNFIQ